MNQHQELAIKALENMKGDEFYRVKAFFRDMNPEQMKEQHGQSGNTRAEVLKVYEDHNANCNAAIAWVKAQA